LEAELRAMETGLKLCWSQGFRKIWVETNSKVAVALIRQNIGPWDVQYILQSIRWLMEKMETKITHVWREGNQAADWFASKGYVDRKFNLIEANEFRGRIKGIVRLDRIGMENIRLV
jgi:ribonuclease HI